MVEPPLISIFEEASPLMDEVAKRLINQRLPVVTYIAACLLESSFAGIPPEGMPSIVTEVLANVRKLIAFMVACEADRMKNGISGTIQ